MGLFDSWSSTCMVEDSSPRLPEGSVGSGVAIVGKWSSPCAPPVHRRNRIFTGHLNSASPMIVSFNLLSSSFLQVPQACVPTSFNFNKYCGKLALFSNSNGPKGSLNVLSFREFTWAITG